MMAPQPHNLARLRRFATVAFAAQLVLILVWSGLLWHFYSLTNDYAVYWQAWWKIGHGHLNPYDTLTGYSYWKDHFVLLTWPLALLTRYGLGSFAPLAVQDLSVFAAGVITFAWVLRLLRESATPSSRQTWMIGASSLAFLLLNPWIYWTLSFDVHLDLTLAAPLVVLATKALYYRQHRRLAIWALLCLLCGDVATTYVAAIGLAGLLASTRPGQRRLVPSGVLVVVGVATFLTMTHLQGSVGAVAAATGGPNGSRSNIVRAGSVLGHPFHVFSALWQQRQNLAALVTPAGVMGLAWVWALPVAAAIVVETSIGGSQFTFDGFQYAAIWGPLVVGGASIAVLAAGRPKARRVVGALLILSLVNTAGWAVVWLPKAPGHWLRIDSAAAQELARARQLIPKNAEVIVSQGVVGRFASHDSVYAFPGTDTDLKPVNTADVYFVIVPYQGVEVAQVEQSLNLLGLLAGPMHATLMLRGGGVWVFHWQPAADLHNVDLNRIYQADAEPAWAARSATGHPELDGQASSWSMTTASRTGGYVLDGADFVRAVGKFDLQVRLSTSGPANVEMWNDDGDVLLARRIIPATRGIMIVDVPVANTHLFRARVATGSFIFKTHPVSPPPGNLLEARVYLPAGSVGTVYGVRLVPEPQ
jgi:hypothetical protein